MAPTSGEDTDLVQWAFDTLTNSYEEYHEGECEGQETRPLRAFASEMPQLIPAAPPATRPVTSSSLFVRGLGGKGAAGSSSREQKCGEPRKQARQEHSDTHSDAQNEVHGDLGNSASRSDVQDNRTIKDERTGRGMESLRANPKSDVPAIERGPVPPPFGNPEPSKPSAQRIGCDEVENGMVEEPQTPEEYAVWMQYYQQCAEYFKQCEGAMATKAGVQPPANTTVAHAVASTATAPTSQVAATSSGNASMTTAHQQDNVTPLAPYAGTLHGFGSPWPRDSISPPFSSNPVHGAPLSGVGGLPQSLGVAGVSSHAGHFTNALHSHSVAPQGVNLAHINASGHMATPPGGAQLGNSVFPSSFASYQQGGLPVLPGLSLGRSGALGGCPQNFGADEELANLLMAWYWSGYHTGHFAARQGR